MTIEQIKEQLSNKFVGILASNKGFSLDKPEQDFGVDLQLKKTTVYTFNGRNRITQDSRYIDIQMKATTESSIIDSGTSIKYDLESKNFNDLVLRIQNGEAPLILILFVLPNDRNSWVDVNIDEVKLRKQAYWYRPSAGTPMTNNTSTLRIEIPKSNLLEINSFNQLHQQFYP